MPVIRFYPKTIGDIDPGWTLTERLKANDAQCAVYSDNVPRDSFVDITDFDFSTLPDDCTLNHVYIGIKGTMSAGYAFNFLVFFWINILSNSESDQGTDVELRKWQYAPNCNQSAEFKSPDLFALGFQISIAHLKSATGRVESYNLRTDTHTAAVDCVWIEVNYTPKAVGGGSGLATDSNSLFLAIASWLKRKTRRKKAIWFLSWFLSKK